LNDKINPLKTTFTNGGDTILLCIMLDHLNSFKRSTTSSARESKMSNTNDIKTCWLSQLVFLCLTTLLEATLIWIDLNLILFTIRFFVFLFYFKLWPFQKIWIDFWIYSHPFFFSMPGLKMRMIEIGLIFPLVCRVYLNIRIIPWFHIVLLEKVIIAWVRE
jgi:hypothetical protein